MSLAHVSPAFTSIADHRVTPVGKLTRVGTLAPLPPFATCPQQYALLSESLTAHVDLNPASRLLHWLFSVVTMGVGTVTLVAWVLPPPT